MFLGTTQSLECWDPTRSVVGVIGRKRCVGDEPETSDITWDVCSDTRGWRRSRGTGKSGVVCCLWPTADLDQISVVAFTFVWLTADLMQGHSFLSSRPWLPPPHPPNSICYIVDCSKHVLQTSYWNRLATVYKTVFTSYILKQIKPVSKNLLNKITLTKSKYKL